MMTDKNIAKELWLNARKKAFKVSIVRIRLIFLLLFLSSDLFGQTQENGYYRIVELRASVDALGNIYMDPLTIKKTERGDSLIKEINNAIHGKNDPIVVLNVLSKKDWELITVSHITSDKDSRPNNPFILYYIRKYVKNKP